MKKIKLHAIGNGENINYYIFDKKQDVAKVLSKIFENILGIFWRFDEEYKAKKGRWRIKKINIEKFKDFHENHLGKGNRIDIFYGDKKMFVTIFCSEKLRLKFNVELSKISIMPKIKKFPIKKLRKKKRKKK